MYFRSLCIEPAFLVYFIINSSATSIQCHANPKKDLLQFGRSGVESGSVCQVSDILLFITDSDCVYQLDLMLLSYHIHTDYSRFIQCYSVNNITALYNLFSDICTVRKWKVSHMWYSE